MAKDLKYNDRKRACTSILYTTHNEKGPKWNVSIRLIGTIICLRSSFYTYHRKLWKQIHDLKHLTCNSSVLTVQGLAEKYEWTEINAINNPLHIPWRPLK